MVYPRLTDISTDTDDPPLFVESGAGGSRYDAASAALQRAAYPAVTTRIYDAPPGEVYAAARGIFDKRGWAIRHSVEPAPPAPPLPDDALRHSTCRRPGAIRQTRPEIRPCRRMSAGPPRAPRRQGCCEPRSDG